MLLPIPEDILQAQARERMLDVLLGSLGLSAAVVSASFAAYMVATAPGGLSGGNRVLVAQGAGVPHGSARALGSMPQSAVGAADLTPPQSLDFTPTGTIPDGSMPDSPASRASVTVLPDFAVRDVFDGTALVEARGTLQMVRPGSVLDGAGEVLSVTRKGNSWAVTTASGIILPRR